MWNDKVRPTLLQSGKIALTLALGDYFNGVNAKVGPGVSFPTEDRPCHDVVERWGSVMVGQLLDDAGDERFLGKVAHFETGLVSGQVLYEGIMRALGYTKNKEPFTELAHRLPLATLEQFCRAKPPAERCLLLQALLLGTAGLLPSQCNRRADQWWAGLERAGTCLGSNESMHKADWRFFRVRPDNWPTRRIVAASYLLTRYIEKGLVDGIVDPVRRADPKRGYRELEQGFMVTTPGYWSNHLDWRTNGGSEVTLIGRGRAREIVVNVVLPFSLAWAQVMEQPELKRKVVELYSIYPKLGENEVTKQMTNQMLGKDRRHIVDSARRQQGLIHLSNRFCDEGRCADCPMSDAYFRGKAWLSQPETGRYIEFPVGSFARDQLKVATTSNHGGIIGTQDQSGEGNGDGRTFGH